MNPYLPPAAPASQPEAGMPKRILLIGLFFSLAGLLSLWDVASAALKGNISLNFGVFLLPVGIGLLRGRASSLPLARSFCLLGLGVSILMIIMSVAWNEDTSFRFLGYVVEGPYAIIPSIILCALVFLAYRLLRSEKAEEYCSRTSRPRCDRRP